MLRYFFDIDERDNAYLFHGLAISKEKEICQQFQNQYPIIFLTFKDIKGNDTNGFLAQFNDCLKDEYQRHAYIRNVLTAESDQETFDRIINGKATPDDFTKYLSLLSLGLFTYHHIRPIILIDEYDVPLNTAHQAECFPFVRDIIGAMFSKGLKTNMNVQAAIITGCLQIAKNQIFTGLNNLAIYTVTDPLFTTGFGFTEEETKALLSTFGLQGRMEDVKNNYDGYHIGKEDI
ncbi:MAG: AAA family ATPase [Sphaerochaeta sp.]|jgi:hypothetical protein|nr:AAA family ATPase [Sphaerochaeta sp.]